MVAQELFRRLPRGTDNYVINVGVGEVVFAENPFRHPLELDPRIFESHDSKFPLHRPPRGGHASDETMLNLHGHLMIPIGEV